MFSVIYRCRLCGKEVTLKSKIPEAKSVPDALRIVQEKHLLEGHNPTQCTNAGRVGIMDLIAIEDDEPE